MGTLKLVKGFMPQEEVYATNRGKKGRERRWKVREGGKKEGERAIERMYLI